MLCGPAELKGMIIREAVLDDFDEIKGLYAQLNLDDPVAVSYTHLTLPTTPYV